MCHEDLRPRAIGLSSQRCNDARARDTGMRPQGQAKWGSFHDELHLVNPTPGVQIDSRI
jgi:hypothetical protein